jgi:hypothetical protein
VFFPVFVFNFGLRTLFPLVRSGSDLLFLTFSPDRVPITAGVQSMLLGADLDSLRAQSLPASFFMGLIFFSVSGFRFPKQIPACYF